MHTEKISNEKKVLILGWLLIQFSLFTYLKAIDSSTYPVKYVEIEAVVIMIDSELQQTA